LKFLALDHLARLFGKGEKDLEWLLLQPYVQAVFPEFTGAQVYLKGREADDLVDLGIWHWSVPHGIRYYS
jgi:hypothetical protein